MDGYVIEGPPRHFCPFFTAILAAVRRRSYGMDTGYEERVRWQGGLLAFIGSGGAECYPS